MLMCTIDAIRAVLRLDPTLEVSSRARIVNAMIKANKTLTDPPTPQPTPRLIRRDEVARRLSISARAVDLLARQGILHKLILPNRARSCGFREIEVTELINNWPQQQVNNGTGRITERERNRALRKLCVELIEHYRGIEGVEIKGPLIDTMTRIGEMIGEPVK